jgi:hypothetical protein
MSESQSSQVFVFATATRRCSVPTSRPPDLALLLARGGVGAAADHPGLDLACVKAPFFDEQKMRADGAPALSRCGSPASTSTASSSAGISTRKM